MLVCGCINADVYDLVSTFFELYIIFLASFQNCVSFQNGCAMFGMIQQRKFVKFMRGTSALFRPYHRALFHLVLGTGKLRARARAGVAGWVA